MINIQTLALRESLQSIVSVMLRWLERAEQRRLLDEMSDSQLRDIGLARDQATFEARRPFWSGHDRPAAHGVSA